MSDTDALAVMLLAAWSAWSLANLCARAGRIAAAIEALRDLAERNRR